MHFASFRWVVAPDVTGLDRLAEREKRLLQTASVIGKEFSEAVLQHAEAQRRKGKSVVICGDVNTAHEEIDLANPKSNKKNTGFLPEEREWVTRLVEHGYIDIFRKRNPELTGAYTWWSNRKGVRERNVGWRIDYFFISPDLEAKVVEARIHSDVLGSDHCPVSLALDGP